MTPIYNPNDRVVCFDVDDTLVMWTGNTTQPSSGALLFNNPVTTLGTGEILKTDPTYLIPHEKHISKLKGYHRSGFFVIVWSFGGGAWAKEVVRVLNLEDHVNLITGKPLYLYDDMPINLAIGERKYFQPKKIKE